MHGSHGQFRKTTPLEESVRVPFIISGESPMGYNKRGVGKIENIFINHADIAPTSLGLCGFKKPNWMDGIDYSSYRLKENEKDKDQPTSAFLQSVIPTMHPDSIDKAWRGIITEEGYKYVAFKKICHG